MAQATELFSGSVPESYDRYMVPMLFEAYAEDLSQRVLARRPSSVLETAAGTGVVTRILCSSLAPDVRYVATDISEAMIAHAQSRIAHEGRVEWQRADALSLPFADASFDVVLCQFGAMFFPDRTAGFAEARRVLRPRGSLIFSTWDSLATNDFAAVINDAAAAVFPDNPPQFFARTPHGYFDLGEIRGDVAKAGFTDITIDTIEKTSTAPSPRLPALALCGGTPLRGEVDARDPALFDELVDRASKAIEEKFGPGEVTGRMTAHIVTACG